MKKLLVATALSLAFSGVAQAIPVTLQFTATDFRAWSETPSPYASISGTIVYEAASLTAPIQSLTSVDLNIGSTVFTVANVGIWSPYPGYPNMSALGGVLTANDQVGVMSGGTTDFWLLFYNDRGTGYQFVYVDNQYPRGGWSVGPDGGRFSQFSLTAGTPTAAPDVSSVPEPASLAMLGLGLAGLFAVRRRRS